MSVNLFNRKATEFCDYINGVQVCIPPYGVTQISEKKAASLIRRHPGVVTLAKHDYTEEDFRRMRRLQLPQLQQVTERFMQGLSVDFSELPAEEAGSEPDGGGAGKEEGGEGEKSEEKKPQGSEGRRAASGR